MRSLILCVNYLYYIYLGVSVYTYGEQLAGTCSLFYPAGPMHWTQVSGLEAGALILWVIAPALLILFNLKTGQVLTKRLTGEGHLPLSLQYEFSHQESNGKKNQLFQVVPWSHKCTVALIHTRGGGRNIYFHFMGVSILWVCVTLYHVRVVSRRT